MTNIIATEKEKEKKIDSKAVGCKLYFLAKIARFEIDSKTDFIKSALQS